MLVLAIWCLHWLAVKRANGLIGEECRNVWSHLRILTLFAIMIAMDGFIVYLFVLNYFKYGKNIGDFYLLVGFEFSHLILMAIEDNLKYQISLAELYYGEQWLEKKFAGNVISFGFDILHLILNTRLFSIMLKRGTISLYIMTEILINLKTVCQNAYTLVKWRQFIHQLKSLEDVVAPEPSGENASEQNNQI